MEEKLFVRRFFLISLLFNIALCSEVPVFLWGGKSLEKLPYVSAMKTYNEEQFQNDFVESLLKLKETLIVYSQDTLSLEDFIHSQEKDNNFHYLKSTFDKESSLIIPSVVNPTQSLFKLNKNYKIKQLYLNESFVDDIVSAAEKNDIIILYSSDNDVISRTIVLNKLDDLMKKVETSLKKLKKSVTYLLTGYNPSWV
ncbi:uncharacterized protein LOC111624217 isoform X2 [Centruroides sculpturatus]|uniref:uncharacterized protein LOC111624217 isoform X2 n=1 Tax=Centruroides sculpturatus TaxID=218467 RepID=UPI000C6CB8C1|nr:uncharacterized protein LOC111624217 isoform X2 [Centruroides sculpturatus]